jgi:hypothetical protein
MPYLFAFKSTKFGVSKESSNPTNPIAGEGVLNWLRNELVEAQYQVTEAAPEDFGWYVEVRSAGASYMVAASDDAQVADSENHWTVQVHKNRALMEKLLGKSKLAPNDPLVGAIERILRGEPGIRDIEASSSD